MSRPATYFRIAKSLVRGDRTFFQWWVRDFPLALAATFGSKDARDSQPSMEEDLKDNVWDLLLLVLGFGLQALAVWVQASQ
jgi:hypothetical protein